MDLLDRLDAQLYDTEAIVEAGSKFARLAEDEQDEYLGLWEYAGLDQAQHPLTSLLRESHNAACVVRDLDGALRLLWQESSISDRWSLGPIYRQNLIDDGSLEALLEDPLWLSEAGISLSASELARLVDELPTAPGPVLDF